MSIRNQLHVQEYVYDYAVDGGTTGEKNLHAKDNKAVIPVGAVIEKVSLKVVTACGSVGSATVAIGNGDDKDGYIDAIAVASLTDNAVFNSQGQTGDLLWDNTNDCEIPYAVTTAAQGQVIVTIAAEALNAGKFIVWIQYYMPTEN